jgi:hypothetical protein
MYPFAFALLFVTHPAGLLLLAVFAAWIPKIVKVLFWLASAASVAFGFASIAVPGFGTKLANGGTSGSSYTNVAQVTDVKLPIGKIKTDDITNFDSPTAGGGGSVYQEFIKTMVEAGDVSFGMVFSPTDPTQQHVAANLQNSPTTSLEYWRLTSQDGTTYVFQGMISSDDSDFKFDKAVLVKASIKVSGPITITWS